MPPHEFIRVREDNRVLRLTLARPPLNVLNIAMLHEIGTAAGAMRTRPDLCAVLIDAEGSVFSAGVDVPEHRQETVRAMLAAVHTAIRAILALPMPTVAAVQGGAYGGGLELAMACDMILAAENAKFAFPEITLGVFPPFAAAILPQTVGRNLARELILTGRVFDATEALQFGLLSGVLPAGNFMTEVDGFVEQFRSLSAFSLSRAKSACRLADQEQLDKALQQIEAVYLEDLMQGEDPGEGLTAFIEKRTPRWRDR